MENIFVTLQITDLEPNRGQLDGLPANPRLIKNSKYELLKRSLKEDPEMLQFRGLLVYKHQSKYIVIGGNMRYKAALELGYKELPCVIIPKGTSVEKLKAYTIKDNNNYGEWDFEMLTKAWDAGDLDSWGVDLSDFAQDLHKKEIVEDNFDEEAQKIPAIAKAGDLYQLGRHLLHCGDSTDPASFQALLKGAIADLVVTDPPYNVDFTSKGRKIANDNLPEKVFFEFLQDCFANISANLKPGGAFYVWYASSSSMEFRRALASADLSIKQQLIWAKNASVLSRQDYNWKHESCLYGWKNGGAHYFVPEFTHTTIYEDVVDPEKMKKEELKEWVRDALADNRPTTVYHCDKPAKNDLHPTMKPVKLMAYLISNSSRKGEKVLEPFGGSGSTLIACEQLDRTCYIQEYDPHYCDVIIARWEQFTGQKAMKI